MNPMFTIEKWGGRYWAVFDGDGLICLAVYKKVPWKSKDVWNRWNRDALGRHRCLQRLLLIMAQSPIYPFLSKPTSCFPQVSSQRVLKAHSVALIARAMASGDGGGHTLSYIEAAGVSGTILHFCFFFFSCPVMSSAKSAVLMPSR